MPPWGSYTGIPELPDLCAGGLLAPSSVLVWSYRFHLLKVCFVLCYGPQGLKIGAYFIVSFKLPIKLYLHMKGKVTENLQMLQRSHQISLPVK